MREALDSYIEARRIKDESAAAFKLADGEFRKAEQQLVDALMNAGLSSAKDDQGRLFSLRNNFYYSATLANTDNILEWLRSRGEDEDQYWRKEIAKKRLTEYMKKVYESEDKRAFPGFFNLDLTPKISVRGWKGADDDE